MSKEREREGRKKELAELKKKQKRIFVIAGIEELIFIIIAIKNYYEDIGIMLTLVMLLVLRVCITVPFILSIGPIQERKWHLESIEKNEMRFDIVKEKYHLNANEFVEVIYSPNREWFGTDRYIEISKKAENGKKVEIQIPIPNLNSIEKLMEEELEVKFYAKIQGEQIIVVKKDKEGNEVGKPETISDFKYFESNYKPPTK